MLEFADYDRVRSVCCTSDFYVEFNWDYYFSALDYYFALRSFEDGALGFHRHASESADLRYDHGWRLLQ